MLAAEPTGGHQRCGQLAELPDVPSSARGGAAEAATERCARRRAEGGRPMTADQLSAALMAAGLLTLVLYCLAVSRR